MSIAVVKPFISAQVNSLGFEEWEDAFGNNNIPSTIIDRSYHQLVVNVLGSGISQETLEYTVIHEVKLFFKAFNQTDVSVDKAIVEAEEVLKKFLNVPDYTTAGLKGVFLDSIDISPLDNEENDNIIVVTITLNIKVFTCLYN